MPIFSSEDNHPSFRRRLSFPEKTGIFFWGKRKGLFPFYAFTSTLCFYIDFQIQFFQLLIVYY